MFHCQGYVHVYKKDAIIYPESHFHFLHAGLLIDDINVLDFPPGDHIATITVNDTLGTSDSKSFIFNTPGTVGE